MVEQRVTADEPVEAERHGLWPSVALTAGITAVTWLSIAFIFVLGYIVLAVFGDIGSGARGLAVWAVLWIAMWAAFTLALGGGLVAAFRAWKALYPLFQPARSRPSHSGRAPVADETLDEVKRLAVEEAEALLRRDDD